MKQKYRTLILWSLLVTSLVFLLYFASDVNPMKVKLKYSEFLDAVDKKQISEVLIGDEEMSGKFVESSLLGRYFEVIGPSASDRVLELLQKNEVKYEFKKKRSFLSLQNFFITTIFLILILLIIFVFRQMQMGGGKAMTFGKSRARLLNENQKRVTFAEVAGIEEAKEELEEIVDFLKDPKKFTKLGGRIPKGVLLMGSPGTGKTLLARAIAGEAGVPFFSISGSDFVEMFVGVGASRVRDLFEQGKKHAPCIIFIDEIDAVGRQRGAGLGGGHDEREQTLNQLLVEMDGFESNEGVILIAATNRPDVLDPALLRPGRFDRRVMVFRPDLRGREAILRIHTRRISLSTDVNLNIIARSTPGFSGADLENLVNEAALMAGRQNKKSVEFVDFERAKDKVLMGAERKNLIINENDKRNTAYHEAGHALVAKLLPNTDPIHKITIIPRGMALGLTQQLPEEEKYTQSKEYTDNKIAILMGGRLAEELFFDHQTTGAGNDIERATEIARKMVCEWGMSEKIGPIAYHQAEEMTFLGKEIAQKAPYSEHTAMLIDEEVRKIVNENYERAKILLAQNKVLLESLAEALLEYETIDAEQFQRIFEGQKLPPLIKNTQVHTEKTNDFLSPLNQLSPGEA